MSEEKKELTLLEELEQAHTNYIQQRDFAQNGLNQAIGAIYANEQAIKKIKEKIAGIEPPQGNDESDLEHE